MVRFCSPQEYTDAGMSMKVFCVRRDRTTQRLVSDIPGGRSELQRKEALRAVDIANVLRRCEPGFAHTIPCSVFCFKLYQDLKRRGKLTENRSANKFYVPGFVDARAFCATTTTGQTGETEIRDVTDFGISEMGLKVFRQVCKSNLCLVLNKYMCVARVCKFMWKGFDSADWYVSWKRCSCIYETRVTNKDGSRRVVLKTNDGFCGGLNQMQQYSWRALGQAVGFDSNDERLHAEVISLAHIMRRVFGYAFECPGVPPCSPVSSRVAERADGALELNCAGVDKVVLENMGPDAAVSVRNPR